MFSEPFQSQDDSTGVKRKLLVQYNRAIIRHIDDAAAGQLYWPAVKAVQSPAGKLFMSHTTGTIADKVTPLIIASTNSSPETLFSGHDQSAFKDTLVFDFSAGADEEGARQRKQATEWVASMLDGGDNNCRADVCLQVVQLATSYMSAPASDAALAELRAQCSLEAFLSRRKVAGNLLHAQAHTPEVSTAPMKALEVWLSSGERFICDVGAGVKLRRSDIYRAAGLGVVVGGPASAAAAVADKYMNDHYQVKPVKSHGHMCYRQLRLAMPLDGGCAMATSLLHQPLACDID
jgi:hypothetical protein